MVHSRGIWHAGEFTIKFTIGLKDTKDLYIVILALTPWALAVFVYAIVDHI